MRRTAAALCIAVLMVSGCSSKKTSGGSGNLGGSNPFSNAPSLTGGGAGSSGIKGSGSTVGNSSTGVGLPGGSCAEGRAQASRVVPRVVLLVDGSCSMSSDYPSTGQDANRCMNNANGRWAAIRKALIDPNNGVVTQLEAGVQFGLAVFGTQPMCPIPGTPVDPALNNLQAITNALPQVQPGMYTPTGPALDWVYQNMFPPAPTGPDQQAPGPQILILATDGEPNDCNPMLMAGQMSTNFQPSIDAVTRGAMQGITTYVISLAAGSGQFHDFLQQLATIGARGQMPTLYEPTTPEQLTANIGMLVGGAIGCDVALNGQVLKGRECEGKVTLNGAPLPCNSPDGWVLPDPKHIRLQGKACDTLKTNKNAFVDANFPCGVFAVQ
jgi:hypothetical protein